MKPHQQLFVWQKSFSLVKDLYLLTNTFPADEKFCIVSQIRRAAISIPCNIAEGAARKTYKEFRHFLYIASGSISELDTLILLSYSLEYLSQNEKDSILTELGTLAKMLRGLINKLTQNISE